MRYEIKSISSGMAEKKTESNSEYVYLTSSKTLTEMEWTQYEAVEIRINVENKKSNPHTDACP